MPVPLFAVRIAEYFTEFSFEHGAHRGVRLMLKTVNRKYLEKLQSRISVNITEDICSVDGTPNRFVSFPIAITNPTPWELEVKDVVCSISHHGIICTHKALVRQKLPFNIGKEIMTAKCVTILYDPFGSPLGIPTDSSGWELNGYLLLSSYFGELQRPIAFPNLSVCKSPPEQKRYLDAIDYVKSKIMR
jgi:hypothetical protein